MKEYSKDDENKEVQIRNWLMAGCSRLTIVIYLIIALLLTISVVFCTFHVIQLMINAISESLLTPQFIVQEILFIIVLATLIDLVRSYFQYGRVILRPILIAGITTMVRKLLVSTLSFSEMLGISIIIISLTAAIYLVGREDRRIANSQNGENELAISLFKKKMKHNTESNSEEIKP